MSRHDERSGGVSDDAPADARVAAALRDALGERDGVTRVPAFAKLWPQAGRRDGFVSRWRPAFAAATLLAVLAGLTWTLTDRFGHRDADGGQIAGGEPASRAHARADLALARELSSPDYWRVPTDELLAFAAPPLSADLPSTRGFEVSLEESLL